MQGGAACCALFCAANIFINRHVFVAYNESKARLPWQMAPTRIPMRMRETAVNQNAIITQLKSPDPKKRFEAIKLAARTKDDSLLRVLSSLARSDPDNQVRAAAAKAEKYIRDAVNAAVAPPEARSAVFIADDEAAEKPKRKQRPATEAEINRARGYVEVALTHQTENERNKALKAMSRALELYPDIAQDAYFRSVLDEITGLSGDESLKLLIDAGERKKIAVTEMELKKEKRAQGHLDQVRKTSWASAGMDLAIYTMICVFSGIIIVIALTQTAASIRPGYQSALAAYNEEMAKGSATAKEPTRPSSEVLSMVDGIGDLNIGLSHAILFGLIMGVSGILGILTQLAATHIVARFLFKGQGTLPHLIYRVVSFYNGRLPILMFLLIISIVVLVSNGFGAIYGVLMAVISLFSLYMTFAVLGRIGQVYDFGIARGCLSWVIGSIMLSVIGSLPLSALMGTVMGQVIAVMTRGISF